MSGHSKWANIKIKKGKTDAKRGKEFTKLGKELMIAVKQGGPDPAANSRLRDVIAKCKAANMPNDTIKRSIDKSAGSSDAENLEEIMYEGYGPGGIAVLVEAATDNRNRTAGEVRHYFDKFGGNLGTSGCVSFMFEKKGIMLIEKTDKYDEDELMMKALEAGAEDFSAEDDDFFEITTEPGTFSATREVLESDGIEFAEADIKWVPSTTSAITDEALKVKMERLIDALEDNDDVTSISHNWEMDEE